MENYSRHVLLNKKVLTNRLSVTINALESTSINIFSDLSSKLLQLSQQELG